MATNRHMIVFILFLVIYQGTNALPAISDHLLSDEIVTDTESVASVNDLLQNLQQNHHIVNTIQSIRRYKCYICEGLQCQHLLEEEPHICTNALQCWKSSVRDPFGVETVSRGCTTRHDHLPFICNNSSPKKRNTSGQINVECCVGDFCNNGGFPELPPLPKDDHEAARINATNDMFKLALYIMAYATISVILITIMVISVIVCVRRRTDHKRMIPSHIKHDPDTYYAEDVRAISAGDSTLREYMQHSMTSGSGSGLPLLVQRTLSKQVTVLNVIGKGRYGGVYRAIWQGEQVAVKIFSSRDEESWKCETEIYSTILLPHENILGYIGSDMTSHKTSTQLWVLTHYYPLGSLYDYLQRRTLSQRETAIICLTIANGLVHLHNEINGTEGKPAIVHRDIKSKNILVRENGTCVIADFGLAVLQKPNTPLNLGSNPRVGTKRYMSPEVLDQRINLNDFEALRRADMYSFALVMWEVCRRTSAYAEEYKVPYYDVVPSDPGFDDMRKVVVLDNYRPIIPNRWSSDNVLGGIAKLMRDCWHHNPNVRLTALRIKKTLDKLEKSTHPNVESDVKIGYDGEIHKV